MFGFGGRPDARAFFENKFEQNLLKEALCAGTFETNLQSQRILVIIKHALNTRKAKATIT